MIVKTTVSTKIVLALFLAQLLACASIDKKAVDLGEGLSLQLPCPEDISQPRRVRQLLTVERENRKKSFEVILEIKKESLSMIALGPLGNTLFTVDYDGKKIKYSSWFKGKQAQFIENALADIVLIYGVRENLVKYLSAGAEIKESKNKRQIYISNKLLVEIVYSNEEHWKGQIEYHHLTRKYRLIIKTLEIL